MLWFARPPVCFGVPGAVIISCHGDSLRSLGRKRFRYSDYVTSFGTAQYGISWHCPVRSHMPIPQCRYPCLMLRLTRAFRLWPPLAWIAPYLFLSSSLQEAEPSFSLLFHTSPALSTQLPNPKNFLITITLFPGSNCPSSLPPPHCALFVLGPHTVFLVPHPSHT